MARPTDYFPPEELTGFRLHSAPFHRLPTRVLPPQPQGQWTDCSLVLDFSLDTVNLYKWLKQPVKRENIHLHTNIEGG